MNLQTTKENQETYTFLASPSPSSLSFGCLSFLIFPESSSVAPSLEEELDMEEFGVDGRFSQVAADNSPAPVFFEPSSMGLITSDDEQDTLRALDKVL